MQRLILTSNSNIAIVAEDNNYNDAENYIKSRQEKQTKDQIGDYGKQLDINKIKKRMANPNLEIKDKKIFTIISNKDDRYLGDIRLVYNNDRKLYEIGIVITPEERSKGYGSQAIKLLSTYVFDTLKMDSIFLRVYQNNPNAKRLYLKLGFKYLETINDGYTVDGINYPEDILILKNK